MILRINVTSSPYPKYVHPIKTVVGSFSGFIALHEPDQDSGVHSSVAIAPNINQQSREKQEWDVVWLDDLYKFRKRSVYSTRYSIIDLRSGHNAHYMYELALPLSAMNLPWIGLTIKLQSYFGIGLDASFVAPGSILQATTHFPRVTHNLCFSQRAQWLIHRFVGHASYRGFVPAMPL